MNILAGRASSNRKIKIESDVRLDNIAVNPLSMKVRKLIAFVAQDDSLQKTATPREAIAFSARLRLPRIVSDDDIEKLTKHMLAELGEQKQKHYIKLVVGCACLSLIYGLQAWKIALIL